MRFHSTGNVGGAALSGSKPLDISFSNNYVPGAPGIRQTYTVPAGKFTMLYGYHLFMLSDGTQTLDILHYMDIGVVIVGSGEVKMVGINDYVASAGTSRESHGHWEYKLEAGDILRINTGDINTGGKVQYNASIFGDEFNI